MPFHVYVLRNGDGRIYVGQTADLESRVVAHNDGRSRWTASRGPWEVIYTEEFETRQDALRREKPSSEVDSDQELKANLEVERFLPRKD